MFSVIYMYYIQYMLHAQLHDHFEYITSCVFLSLCIMCNQNMQTIYKNQKQVDWKVKNESNVVSQLHPGIF